MTRGQGDDTTHGRGYAILASTDSVFHEPPCIPGGPDGQMKCPTCGEHSGDDWKRYAGWKGMLSGNREGLYFYVDWMACGNDGCKQVVVRAHECRDGVFGLVTQSWVIWPRHASSNRNVDPNVPDAYRRDFLEAAAILDASPRMSAVLSRRILADLLEQYAGRTEFKLGSKLNKFSKDKGYSTDIRENARSLNEIADFGAHTQKGDQAEIIDVDHDEAEWTLDFVERLFDLFIVTPERDRAMRARIGNKTKRAGRTELPPLSDGAQNTS